jgi:AraC-like DNA-binding protein
MSSGAVSVSETTSTAPDVDPPFSPRVSGHMVLALVDGLQSCGVGAEALLGQTSRTTYSELAERRVPLAEYQALLGRATVLSRDPGFGLICGLRASESTFGVMAPLVAHTQSLRHAISICTRFHAVLCDGVRLELVEHSSSAQLRFKLHPGIERSLIELMVAGVVRTLECFGCTGEDIRTVCFEYKSPPRHSAYTAAFGVDTHFSQPFTGVEFQSHALDRPHVRWQPELQALVLSHAERKIAQLVRQQTTTERVQVFLRNHIDQEQPSIAEAARQLGTSERSLRRRLDEEGTSFRELAQATRCQTACALLRDPEHTIKTVAHALGFSCQSSFHRAFTRWTTTTPMAYRSRNQTPVGA